MNLIREPSQPRQGTDMQIVDSSQKTCRPSQPYRTCDHSLKESPNTRTRAHKSCTPKAVITILRFDCDTTTTRLRRKIEMFIFCSCGIASNGSRRARYVVVGWQSYRKPRPISQLRLDYTTRLRYDDTTMHSTTTEVIEITIRAEPRLHAALVSAAKVMRCIQCSLVQTVRRYIN